MRDALDGRAELSERMMFGGLAFMLAGNMALCVMREELLVRFAPADAEEALAREGVRACGRSR